MDWDGTGCPIWIDPGSGFRLVVKISSWVAEDEYVNVPMDAQEHDIWFDRNEHYSLAKFLDAMSTKIFWGPQQTLAAGHLKVIKGPPVEAEVSEIYKDEEVRRHVVYLQQHACTCREWQLTGKPCPHALAVITCLRQPNMGLFVNPYYSVEKFQAAYHGIIPHITDRNQWPVVDKGFALLAPAVKTPKGPGRQKKNRHLGPFERIGRRTGQAKCTACGEYGHRVGSWRCSQTGTKKRKRTKKSAPRPGRPKKSKVPDEGTNGCSSPRTRAAAAKEEAERAKKLAQLAADKALLAAEAAAAAANEGTAPGSPHTPTRNTGMEVEGPSTTTPRTTPRRKILCTKIKKITPKKKTAGKKK